MADRFTIEIATPERLLAREEAVSAQIPARDGYIGILPNHAALLSALGAGVLSFTSPAGQETTLAVKGGFLEILDNCVRVLTDRADRGSEIDVAKSQAELKTAEAAMADVGAAADPAQALIDLQHAQAKIDLAGK